MSQTFISPASRRMSVLLRQMLLVASVGVALPVIAEEAAANKADAKSTAVKADATAAVNKKAPVTELTPQILYQFMLAEVAGSRGKTSLAVGAYTDLAQVTRDPRIAKRATEVAMYARQFSAAEQSALVWVEQEPESIQARQTLMTLAAVMGRPDEIADQLSVVLAQEGKNVGDALLRINGLLTRVSDKAAAQRAIERVTQPYLNFPEAHFARAQAAFAAKDMTTTKIEVDQALAMRPDWEHAALFKALLVQQKPADVIAVLDPFVRANPGASDAELALARALVAEKRLDEARGHFQNVLDRQPKNTDVMYAVGLLATQAQDYPTAQKLFTQLIDAGYAESNLLRTYMGQMAEDQKQTKDAVGWYTSVSGGPQYIPSQTRAAQLLMKSGKSDEARKVLQRISVTSDTDRAHIKIAEAQLLRDENKHEASYVFLSEALKAQPEQPELIYETALAADKLAKYDESEKLLRQLIQLKPDYAQAYNALGYSLADRNIRLDEAQKLIDKALELTPGDPFILDSKGWMLYRRGDLQGALAALQQAYGLRPDAEIAAHLGEVLWALGRQPDARKIWQDAARENPGNEALADTIKKFVP